MHDLVVVRRDLADRHVPAFGGGGLEHLPAGGAALAHRLQEMTQAARSVGILVAVFRLVAGRLHDADMRPVGVELLGDDQRQRGARAGPHLRAMRDDGDLPARVDRDEHLRVEDGAAGHIAGTGLVGERRIGRQQPCGEHEPAGRGDALEEAAAADVFDDADGRLARDHMCHVTPPSLRI